MTAKSRGTCEFLCLFTLLARAFNPCPLRMGSRDLLSGYLRKKSPKKVLGYPYWQRRYFVLDTQTLKYYKTHEALESEDCRGILPLALIVSIKLRTSVPERFDLALKDTDRVFHFIAETPREARQWTQIIAKQLGLPVISSDQFTHLPYSGDSDIENKTPKPLSPGSSSNFNNQKRYSDAASSLSKKRENQKFWKPKRNTLNLRKFRSGSGLFAKGDATSIRKKDIVPLTVSSDNPYLRDTGVYAKDPAVRSKLLDWCTKATSFRALNKDAKNKVVDRMWNVKFTKESEILSQGQRASEFCVIESGSVTVMEESLTGNSVDNKRVTAMPVGHTWGELALMYETRSIATYTAAEGTSLWVIDGRTFQAVVADAARAQCEMREQFLKTIDLFAGFSDQQYAKLADELQEEVFAPEDRIIAQGKEGDKFFLLQAGEALVTKRLPGSDEEKHVWTYRDGSYFGELALLTKNLRAATVTAKTECLCLSLYRKWFYEILGPIENKLRERSAEYKQQRDPDGRPAITSPDVNKSLKITSVASPTLTITAFSPPPPPASAAKATPTTQDSDTPERQGGPRFHLSNDTTSPVSDAPSTGSAGKSKGGPRFHMPGDDGIPEPPQASPHTDKDTADNTEGPVRLQFMQDKSDSEGDYSSDSDGESEKQVKRMPGDPSAPGSPQRKKRVSDFRVIGTLGKGSFGHVQLVEDSNKVTYALKSVSKSHLVKHGQQSHILSEKKVMEQLDHPFVVRLMGTFQDKNCLHFLMEPSLGGELFSLMRKHRYLPEPASRFYAGCVVLAFEYMHNKNIIYRDLKPENLLLGEDGYLKITDYGFAIQTAGRTYTMCGTPDYLAPEMIACKGHGKGVDWWTVGIFIYEMLVGKTPFADNRGPNKIYDKIIAGNIEFPSSLSREAVSLIRGLLEPKPTHRLGVLSGGAQRIKDHPWFRGFSWEKLLEKQIPPPFKKRIRHKHDLANFDFYPEETIFEEYDGDTSWCKDF
eukprot:g16848.t1